MKSKFLDSVKEDSFVVFYASQLGQAESIAEGIVEKAPEYDFVAHAFPLNAVSDVKDLATLGTPIVIVASTTGDGEPPENADKFWRKVRRKILKKDTLDSVNYTVLGLGDTNYNYFCNCGKEINKRFQELGAKAFYCPGWADDAVGLEAVVDDWLDGLWFAIENLIRPGPSKIMEKNAALRDSGVLTLPACPPVSLTIEYYSRDPPPVNLEDPILQYPLVDTILATCSVINATRLSKPGALKNTLEITLKFDVKTIDFEPGDAIGIVCPNPSDEVAALLKRLGAEEKADNSMSLAKKEENSKGKVPTHVSPGCSIRQAFLYYVDIRAPPKKTLIRLLAEFTSEEKEKQRLLELSSRQGSAEFESCVRLAGLSLLDILNTYPSCLPPVIALLEHLPRLIPRAYSIASSPLDSKDTFTVAFNVIDIPKESGRTYSRLGVCTGWLMRISKQFLDKDYLTPKCDDLANELDKLSLNKTHMQETKKVIIYKRKNHNFRLPEDLNAPVVMVGPGTGVAPFIGFLNHRNHLKSKSSVGKMLLYFGCRNRNLDYLYEDQLMKLKEDGILTDLHVSFSREDENSKIKYVQHNMELNKEELITTVLDENGYFYVCGDATNMAKNVKDTFTECLQAVKGISEEEAKATVARLVTEKRYLQDVWG